MPVFDALSSPFAQPEQVFANFPAIQKASLDKVLTELTREQEVTALVLESEDSTTEVAGYLLAHLPIEFRALTLRAPWPNEREFLQALASALGIESQAADTVEPAVDLITHIIAALNAGALATEPKVLIVQNVHLASTAVMHHLLAISSASSDSPGRLHTLLIGQHGLLKRLPRPEAKLEHDVRVVIHHVPDLSELDTIDHIRVRMDQAGWQGPLPFELSALKRIHAATRGLPARINTLCESALQLAQERHQPTVTDATVATVLGQVAPREVMPTPAPTLAEPRPSMPLPAVAPTPQSRTPQIPSAKPSRRFPTRSVVLASVALLAIAAGIGLLMPASTPTAATVTNDNVVSGFVQPSPAPDAPPSPATESAMVELKVPATEPTDAAIELAGASLPNLTSLSDDTAAAWASMGSRWGLKLQGISPCAEALTQGHQCFRTLEANVATLKELDRPGLAQLEQNGVNRWVELTAWRGDVVVMALGKSSWQVPATDFAKLWTGRFTTLWRQPLDQTSRIYAAKPDDAAGQWLNTELQKLQAKGELPTSADSYQKRVIAFQKTHGLSESDGVALPSTFIKLNPLVGVVEPKLSR